MKRSIHVEIMPRGKDESLERMIKRFTKKVKKEKIIEKVRDRSYYEKPSVKRRKKAKRRKRILEKLRKKNEQR